MTYYCVNLSIATTRLVVTLGVKRAAPRDNKTKGRKSEKQKLEVFKRSWNKTKRDSTSAAIIALFPGLLEVKGGGGVVSRLGLLMKMIGVIFLAQFAARLRCS